MTDTMPCSAPIAVPPREALDEVERLDTLLSERAAREGQGITVQPGGPGTEMRCPSCGHTDTFDGDAATEGVTCTECGALIAYGYLMPRWVNDPHPDGRMLLMRIDAAVGDRVIHLELPVTRAFAHRLALDLLAVCGPPGP